MDLVPKLTHSIREVRERAWDSLLFKHEHGFLKDGMLSSLEAPVLTAALSLIEEFTYGNDSDALNIARVVRAIQLVSSLLQNNPYLASTKYAAHVNSVSVLLALKQKLCSLGETNATSALIDHVLQQFSVAPLETVDAHTWHRRTSRLNQGVTESPSRRSLSPIRVPKLHRHVTTSNLFSFPESGRNTLRTRMESTARTRSRSPLKQPVFQAHPSPSKIPPLPHALQTYHGIHLSQIDEEAVADFMLFIQQATVDNEIEQKLFHILLTDFGSEIFLQKSQLFRTILAGLESGSPARASQNLVYITRLSIEWLKTLRQFIDGPVSLSSRTPVSLTPNVSIARAPAAALGHSVVETSAGAPAGAATFSLSQPDVLPGSGYFGIISGGGAGSFNQTPSGTEAGSGTARTSMVSLSIPYACQELWSVVSRLMSEGSLGINALEVLENVRGMVLLQLDAVVRTFGSEEERGAGDVEYALELLGSVTSSILAIDREACASLGGVSDEERNAWKDKVLEFVSVVAADFALVLKNNVSDLHWKLARNLINLPSSTPFPKILANSLIPVLDPNSAPIVLNLIGHHYAWVRRAGFEALLKWVSEASPVELSVGTSGVCAAIKDPFIQYISVKSSFRDEDNDTQILAKKYVTESVTKCDLQSCLEWIQAFSDEDDCAWLMELLNSLPGRRISFWIKGMFHRSEKVRGSSFHQLVQLYPQYSGPDSSMNALIFNQSVLSIHLDENERRLREGRFQVFDVNEFAVQLQNVSPSNMDIICSGIERLSAAIFDPVLILRARELKILPTLLNFLEQADLWFQKESILLHLIKICRVLTSVSQMAVADWGPQKLIEQISHPNYLFHANEFIRYEFAKLLFLLLFSHHQFTPMHLKPQFGLLDNGTVFIFESLPDKYCTYVTTEHIPLKQLENTDIGEKVASTLLAMYQEYPHQEGGCSPGTVWTKSLVAKLSSSCSHSQFATALNQLFQFTIFAKDYELLQVMNVQALLSRFLNVHPANPADETLFTAIVSHLSKSISKSKPTFLAFKDLLFNAIPIVILPVIRNATNAKVLVAENPHLASELIYLIKNVLKQGFWEELGRCIKLEVLLEVLINHTYYVFSLECKDIKSHSDRINCLESLVEFAQVSNFTAIVNGPVATSFIQLLVSLVGLSQQNYVNSTAGHAYTYQDRSVYRLVALGLRNISRCFVVFQPTFKSWLWGDHWLFEGDIDWLLVLLNDDERIIQKHGLGILGNLILIKDSYPQLCMKIPQFLDMAFLFALDYERNYMLRKEALIIINNFLITFCHDNKISIVPLLPSSDESLADIEQPDFQSMSIDAERSNNNADKVSELLEIFEHCGFFECLRDLLSECDQFVVIYMDALTSLLLNLFILAPKVMFQRFCIADSWSLLLSLLGMTYMEPARAPVDFSQSLLLKFRNVQFHQCYYVFMQSVQGNILKIFSLAMFSNEEGTRYLIESTAIMDHLKGIIHWFSSIQQPSIENMTTCLSMLCCMVHIAPTLPVFPLAAWLKTEDTAIEIFQLGILSGQDNPLLCKVWWNLISQLFALHYSNTLDLNMEAYLNSSSHNVLMSKRLTDILIWVTEKALDSHDCILLESLKTCYQVLMSKSQSGKQHAISKNIIEESLTRITKLCKGRLSHNQSFELHFSICILRHVLSNSVEAKKIAFARNIFRILHSVLHIQDVDANIITETVFCLQNATVNCHQSSAWTDMNSKMSSTLLDSIWSLMKFSAKSQADLVFSASIDLLKVLVLISEVRAILLKATFLPDCLMLMRLLAKEKNVSKVTSFLSMLQNFTLFGDGQYAVVKAKGFFAFLIDLLSWPSTSIHLNTLAILKNLAFSKEHKPHFLTDENFVAKLVTLLRNCKGLIMAEALTSFVWVLVYNSERTKAALKLSQLIDILHGIEVSVRLSEKTKDNLKLQLSVSTNIEQICRIFAK